MAVDLAEFIENVKLEFNEAAALDSYLPKVIRRAAEAIESNWSLAYMEEFSTLPITAGTTPPRFDLGVGLIEILDWQYIGSDTDEEQVVHLIRVDSADIASIDSGKARHFWLDGGRYVNLDAIASVNYDTALLVVRRTPWPTDTAQAPWLVVNAEDLLLAETMFRLSLPARDPKLMEMYSALKDQAVKLMLIADTKLRESMRDSRMVYIPGR